MAQGVLKGVLALHTAHVIQFVFTLLETMSCSTSGVQRPFAPFRAEQVPVEFIHQQLLNMHRRWLHISYQHGF